MSGKSGTVMTLETISGLIGRSIPLIIGIVADKFGLGSAMRILIAGPMALFVGLPRQKEI